MKTSKNISLVIGITIPVLMIVLIIASIYLPRYFIHPKYDFLYVLGDEYYYVGGQQYFVKEGRLIRIESKKDEKPHPDQPRSERPLYVFDINKDESREVSFDEAQKLNLNGNIKSPDGFEVTHGQRGDGFLFFWSTVPDHNSVYLKGNSFSKKLNVQVREVYYDSNFRFLGWIE